MYTKIAKLFLACLAAGLISPSYSEEISSDGRIVDGVVIKAAQASYMVRLKHINGDHVCGGTLVRLQFVVTAAHCLNNVDPITQLLVVSGVDTLAEAGQQRSIVKYAKSEFYNPTTLHMDYAVLKLNTPMISGPNTFPIPLNSNVPPIGTNLQVSGFGRQVGGGERSYYLRSTIVQVIANAECYKHFGLTTTMFCAAQQNTGPCHYDSGGPVVRDNQLYGIVSFGPGDCNYSNGSPAVFTSINVVYPYIQNAINTL